MSYCAVCKKDVVLCQCGNGPMFSNEQCPLCYQYIVRKQDGSFSHRCSSEEKINLENVVKELYEAAQKVKAQDLPYDSPERILAETIETVSKYYLEEKERKRRISFNFRGWKGFTNEDFIDFAIKPNQKWLDRVNEILALKLKGVE